MLESVTTSALTNRINWHLNNQTVCVVTVGEGSRRVSSAGLWWGFVFGTDRMPSSYWTLSSTWSLINKVPPQDGDQSQSEIRFKLWQKDTSWGLDHTYKWDNIPVSMYSRCHQWKHSQVNRDSRKHGMRWATTPQMQQSKNNSKPSFFHTQKWKCWSCGQRASTLCKSFCSFL